MFICTINDSIKCNVMNEGSRIYVVTNNNLNEMVLFDFLFMFKFEYSLWICIDA